MQVLSADYLLICDKEFKIIKNGAVCFDEKIIQTGKKEELFKKYENCKKEYLGKNSILMPSLINTHVHLEFSANKTTLKYGDFITWLQSVIRYRDTLQNGCKEECYKNAVNEMLKSGTGAFGEISSKGDDLDICVKTPQKVVFFNEVLGSQPSVVDALYQDFLNRLNESKKYSNDRFYPAISVHSPYSTHPILAKKVLRIAKEENMRVSTHFMESLAEREWIDKAEGDFLKFFENFIPNSKPMSNGISYLKLFDGVKTLFTHGVYATKEELEMIKERGFITHCPVSNRLLNNSLLDLNLLEEVGCDYNIATDGLSSNISLNLWNELRCALLMQTKRDLSKTAKELLTAATRNGASALKLESGTLEKDKDADIIAFRLPEFSDEDQLPIQIILHINQVEKLFINGEEQCLSL